MVYKKCVGLFGRRASSNELGSFAMEIYDALSANRDFTVVKLDFEDAENVDFIVYASRSSTELSRAGELALQHDIPLVILSSDLQDEIATLPAACDVRIIPNSSIDIQNYVQLLVDFYLAHPDWRVSITEYHQSQKADVSGTALAITKQLGVPDTVITSIRDDHMATQRFLIPPEFAHSYAVHQVKFSHPQKTTEQLFEIKITGRSSYVDGLITMLRDL